MLVMSGTSHVTTKQHRKCTVLVDAENALLEATVTHSELHATRMQWVCRQQITALYKKQSTTSWANNPVLATVTAFHKQMMGMYLFG